MGEEYYEDEMKKRVIKRYYENGKIQEEMTYINGARDGIVRQYKPSGAIVEVIYNDGKAIEGFCVPVKGEKFRLAAEGINLYTAGKIECE
jgi:hypothetical protein